MQPSQFLLLLKDAQRVLRLADDCASGLSQSQIDDMENASNLIDQLIQEAQK